MGGCKSDININKVNKLKLASTSDCKLVDDQGYKVWNVDLYR